MKFDVISSGSKGNATIVMSSNQAILLDFGISKKRVSDALKDYGFTFDDLQAVFLTHTHSDHASDVFNVIQEKLFCPQPKVPKVGFLISGDHLVKAYQVFHVGVFTITALPLSHDCPNTMGYLVDDGFEKLLYVTDTGFVPEKNFPYMNDCTYYIFESNHDPKMLYESRRPDYLIRRIISDTGHLSNYDGSYYLSNLIGNHTKEVVLCHLSDECNTPSLAIETFESVMQTQLGYLPDIIVNCASDKRETKGGGE
jgi:phosphoribosyl 1,2-cyclic phosphodiesterase